MNTFLIHQSDIVCALGAAVAFMLAAVCFIVYKYTARELPWRVLGFFGIVHGLYGLTNVILLSSPDNAYLALFLALLGVVSILALIVFAWLKNRAGRDIKPLSFMIIAVLLLCAGAGLIWKFRGLNVVMGLLACAAGAVWLGTVGRAVLKSVQDGRGLAGKGIDIGGGLYLIIFGWKINMPGMWFDLAGFSFLVIFLMYMIVVLKKTTPDDGAYSPRRIVRMVTFLTIVCFVSAAIGLIVTELFGASYRHQYEQDLLLNTSMGAISLSPSRILRLSGTPQDELLDEYQRLQQKLSLIKRSTKDYRYVYLMGLRNNQVVFLVDSTPSTSPEFSPPGQVYEEASLGLRSLFENGRSLIEGPMTDRWGTWVSALVPVKDDESDQVIAVLGVDVDALQFIRYIQMRRLTVISVFLLLYLILAAYLIYHEIIGIGLKTIRLSEANFQAIFEQAPEGVAIYEGETGHIVAVNRFFANLLGYARDVFARARIQEITGWNDELFQEHVDTVVQGQIGYIPEIAFKQRGGSLIDVDVISSPMTFKGTACILSFVRDISEKKKIERALQDAKEYSDLLFHIVPSAIFTVDKNCVVTSWNKRAAELTGFSVFEVIGKHCSVFADIACKERCSLVAPDITKPINNKESTIRTKDGRNRVIMKNIDVIRSGDGKITGGIESFEDITDRKRTEEKLRQLSQAVEQSPSTVVVTDTDGAIEYVNPKFTETTGYQLHEVVGRNPRILKSGDKLANVYKEMWETIKAGRTWHGEFLNKKKNGDIYWEFAGISGIRDQAGNITHFLKVAEDITNRKQIEKFKDDFVNTVSHELRTPLTAIRESINIVYDGSTGPVSADQKDFLETAKRNVDRLGRLINDVLDFQKLQGGVMRFEKKETDINNLLEEVRQTMQMLTSKKGLELHMDLSVGLPMVFVDRDKIIQVLVNLVNNAVKFTNKGGITLVSSLGENNTIRVSVVDTGVGIKKEDHAKLFQSFSQVAAPEYRKTGSTGLGLAISKEIIRQHGGKINVESEPGKGSTFYFILPVLDRRTVVREEHT